VTFIFGTKVIPNSLKVIPFISVVVVTIAMHEFKKYRTLRLMAVDIFDEYHYDTLSGELRDDVENDISLFLWNFCSNKSTNSSLDVIVAICS
jgi:hypothetical protein